MLHLFLLAVRLCGDPYGPIRRPELKNVYRQSEFGLSRVMENAKFDHLACEGSAPFTSRESRDLGEETVPNMGSCAFLCEKLIEDLIASQGDVSGWVGSHSPVVVHAYQAPGTKEDWIVGNVNEVSTHGAPASLVAAKTAFAKTPESASLRMALRMRLISVTADPCP